MPTLSVQFEDKTNGTSIISIIKFNDLEVATACVVVSPNMLIKIFYFDIFHVKLKKIFKKK